MGKKTILFSILLFSFFFTINNLKAEPKSEKLSGTPICSEGTDSKYLENAFDSDLVTEFKSSSLSGGWVGLELSSRYRITSISFSQKAKDKSSYIFGIFEGSNSPDFIDAIPLYMITKGITPNKMEKIDINVNYSFKYLRYIGPSNKTSLISEIEFYGYESEKNLPEGEENLYQISSLPLVVIHTENFVQPKDKETDVESSITIIDKNKRNTKAKASIRLNGNSTMKLIKKPYQIIFHKEQKPLTLSSKAKTWYLLANYADKTLIRNALALHISQKLEMPYTPECIFVDLMVNGEFKGNYNLCDIVEANKRRVEVTEMDESCEKEPEITGGYLIEVTGYTNQEPISGKTEKGIPFRYIYPKNENITKAQRDYIAKKFSEVEEEVYSGNLKNIDVKGFIKYMFIQEITANIDTTWSNYIKKEREDDTLYFGPVWDFDIAFGNDQRLYPIKNVTNFMFKYASSAGSMREFVKRIFSNEDFLEKYKKTWKEVRKEIIDTNELNEFIDEQAELIKDSRELNYQRWDNLIRKVKRNPVVGCTYENEVKYLKEWIKERLEQLDEMVENADLEFVNEKIKTHYGPGGSDPAGVLDESCLKKEDKEDKEDLPF